MSNKKTRYLILLSMILTPCSKQVHLDTPASYYSSDGVYDLVVTLTKHDDSIYVNYICVSFGGDYINESGIEGVPAGRFKATDICNNSIILPALNFRDYHRKEGRYKYDSFDLQLHFKNEKEVVWSVDTMKYRYLPYLPHVAFLKQIKE